MAKKKTAPSEAVPQRRCGVDIPMRVIRRYVRQIVERFAPDKIILFGSYAYGTPHEDSDVDLLVIMPARNLNLAVQIRWEFPAPFPMDLLVRTPAYLQSRLEIGDSFLREIVSKGKVLYEKDHSSVGEESRTRSRGRGAVQPRRRPSA